MKRLILFSFLALSLASQALQAQTHIKNQVYLQLNVGAYDGLYPWRDTHFLQLEYAKYNRKLNARGFGLMYAKKRSGNQIPVEKYQLSFKQELNVLANASLTSTFKVLGTVNFGYESINKDKPMHDNALISTPSAFLLGLGVGAEYEFTPVVLGVRTTYNFLSQYQRFSTYPYLGIKLHIQ